MVKIDPTAFYTRGDLVQLFDGLKVDPDELISRIKPRKIHRFLWWGGDLIQAIENAPALTDTPALPAARSRGGRKGKAVSGFTPEELGLESPQSSAKRKRTRSGQDADDAFQPIRLSPLQSALEGGE